ncbi:MAG: alpha/beta fold hydrolase [Chloroflexota bacterium]
MTTESRRVDLAGRPVHYLAAGDAGPTVILLHGGGVDAAGFSFHDTIPALAPRFRVIAPDWPGYGESAPPPPGWGVPEYVTFLGQLLDRLEIPRASLIGLSMGGAIALGAALQAPERVDRLVLVDSYGLGRELPAPLVSYLFVHLPLNELSWTLLRASAGSRWLARLALRATLPCHPERVTEELVDDDTRLMRRPDAGQAWIQFQRREVRWLAYRTNYLEYLPEVRVPTLLVHGARDPAVPVAWSERAHRLIPDAQLAVIPESGHVTPMEQPERFNVAVLGFLTSSPPPGDSRPTGGRPSSE